MICAVQRGTGFARIGISDTIGERILNHAAGDRMTAIYNRHGYLLEMRTALDAWAARIVKLDADAPGKERRGSAA